MELFWLTVLVLSIIAVLPVVKPLFTAKKTGVDDDQEFRVSIYRQNLQELEAEYSAGQVSESQFDNVKNEMELSLLHETGNNRTAETPETGTALSAHKKAGLISGLVLFIFSLLLYYLLGNPQLIALGNLGAITDETSWSEHPLKPEMIALMESHLQRNPGDVNGLFYLANMYIAESDFDRAVQVFERLYQITGDNPQVLMAYADTLVRANQGSFQGRATELIHRVLSIEPGNHTALLFAGLAAEEAGNYREANEFYSKLLPVLQNRPDLSQTVNGLIARNNMLMQEEGSTTEALPGEMEAQVADPGKSVQLRISVSDEVAGNYKVGDTLFVYAQAQDGSPMPLAVVRTTVGEFPMDVTLDDSMAMMPTRKLSDFESVRIQARISKSGNAEPGSGDVVGVAEQVSVPDTAVTGIELNEILP